MAWKMNKLTSSNMELDLDRPNIEDYLASDSIQEPLGKLRLHDLLDISPTLTEAVGAIVDARFIHTMLQIQSSRTMELECVFVPIMVFRSRSKIWNSFPCKRALVELICSFFVASWTGVVKYHGPRPCARPKQVFVANHTSMIDFIILEQMTAFAVIMQKHPGWVGLLQSTILESLGCIWFNRSESKDREIVARKLREHVEGADNNPLLIFPEGTCVNNHYSVMFKKGAFELGSTVCPIAIKYNKIFVDAFWNSRKQSFTTHLLQLMTSWAVVCDVWYLEPQNMKPGETAIEFAERQQSFAESVLRRLEENSHHLYIHM
uniref:Phospholipid/glycerol acyltransferase domain-containing protein n=1 Tax=Lactuca sativa TaxID=4236 RepID=A0A9R1UTS0_LACSA|nr:hypothetical protein LSAT_V11C800438310 [Lactuca sativa]